MARHISRMSNFIVFKISNQNIFQAQVIGITADIWWSELVEKRLAQSQRVDEVLTAVDKTLELLSDSVLRDQPSVRRRKIEMLVRNC